MRARLSKVLVVALLSIGTFSVVHAGETLPQRYLDIYLKIHDAESLEKKGDYAGALKGFQDCCAGFSAIRQSNPDWEPALVGHRMADCQVAIERLQGEAHLQAATIPPGGASSATTPAASSTTASPSNIPDFKTASLPVQKLTYPWHTGIITTFFYIREGQTAFTADPAIASAGFGTQAKESTADDPNDRNGYASGSHASGSNPFYVALPFNDLAWPDKAKKYVPAQWHRSPVDGKPVSACKDRWVEIKTEDGAERICYAQWEDVGPLRNDHAEYVFGSERPNTYTRAGLDVSPAVAEYLGLAADKRPLTRWRFVDPDDVPPGQWLKLEEQAVLYTAMHESKDFASASAPMHHKQPSPAPPISPNSTKP